MNWQTIDNDSNLPEMQMTLDNTTVKQLFAGSSLEEGSAVANCRRQSVDYAPAARCVATYALELDGAQTESKMTKNIGVVEAVPAGLKQTLFTADPSLPGLSTATNAAALQARFDANNELGQLESITPIRYKPDSRCSIRYNVENANGTEAYFGKVLAQGDGTRLANTVNSLYNASLENADLPRIPQPLAFWSDLQLLLQASVPGMELHEAAFDTQIAAQTRLNWLHQAGRATAALHSNVYIDAPTETFVGDLNALNDYRPAMHKLNPALASRFDELTRQLQASMQQPELNPVVSHGALRTDQFLIDGDQLVLIDLDGVCWSNPARDLGNFSAYLSWKALRQPQNAAFIGQAKEAFLQGYASARTLPTAQWLHGYEAASILKIVGRRYTGLTRKEWHLTEELLDLAL